MGRDRAAAPTSDIGVHASALHGTRDAHRYLACRLPSDNVGYSSVLGKKGRIEDEDEHEQGHRTIPGVSVAFRRIMSLNVGLGMEGKGNVFYYATDFGFGGHRGRFGNGTRWLGVAAAGGSPQYAIYIWWSLVGRGIRSLANWTRAIYGLQEVQIYLI
jgi:hypothetical protein